MPRSEWTSSSFSKSLGSILLREFPIVWSNSPRLKVKYLEVSCVETFWRQTGIQASLLLKFACGYGGLDYHQGSSINLSKIASRRCHRKRTVSPIALKQRNWVLLINMWLDLRGRIYDHYSGFWSLFGHGALKMFWHMSRICPVVDALIQVIAACEARNCACSTSDESGS